MARRSQHDVLGARNLTRFDFCIIGSGAGGGTAAHVLTVAGKNVLASRPGTTRSPAWITRRPSRPRSTATTS
jgi:choline dehydrogenase-like flavoprotein